MLQSGARFAHKFRLEVAFASGGMGSLWRAWNTQLDIPVAIKVMSPAVTGSQELVARFEKEAKSAAQLRHPNVVQVFEHGMFMGQPYIVMELLEGEDLRERFKRVGRLSLVDTARVVGDVCKALRRAHDMGIVHRDLKPANVFLARHDDDETVKVLDFGIAKSLGSGGDGVTQTGALLGTPHYMSPEQARRTNKQVDHRTDLWSLGVIAYRALTGSLPFPGDDSIDVLVRICTERAPPASSVAPDLGPAVDAFFERALSAAQEGRFQSAREMSDALHTLSGRAPIDTMGPASAPVASVPVSGSVPVAAGEPASPGVSASGAMSAAAREPEGDRPSVSSAPEGRGERDLLGEGFTVRMQHPYFPAPPAQEPAAPVNRGTIRMSVPPVPPPEWMPAPGASGPHTPAESAGTLTGAGTESFEDPVVVPMKRPWIALAAAALGVVAVLAVAIGMLAGRSPAAQPGALGSGASAAVSAPPSSPAPESVPPASAQASAAATASAEPPAASDHPAAPSAEVPASAPSVSATAKSAPFASSATGQAPSSKPSVVDPWHGKPPPAASVVDPWGGGKPGSGKAGPSPSVRPKQTSVMKETPF